VAKEAVFLVSMATEKFIARIAESAKSQAGREKRTTVQRKDIRESILHYLVNIVTDEIIQ
jgi:histone H3/H4